MLLLITTLTKFQIRDQFDIRQGISIANSKGKMKEKKAESGFYKVVNLSGIDVCSGEIDESKLISHSPIRDIAPDKLLTKLDYLISCKGEVNGFSMLLSEDILSRTVKSHGAKGIVASNHFLVLRPRMILGLTPDDIRFLHNLLDILLLELRTLATSKPGIAKYLTINDVANYVFNFPFKDPKEIEDFKTVSSQYRSSLKKFKDAKFRLMEYNRIMADKILISQ